MMSGINKNLIVMILLFCLCYVCIALFLRENVHALFNVQMFDKMTSSSSKNEVEVAIPV